MERGFAVRRWVMRAVVLGIVVVGVEGLAQLAYLVMYRGAYHPERIAELAGDYRGPRSPEAPWEPKLGRPRAMHPFLGYTLERPAGDPGPEYLTAGRLLPPAPHVLNVVVLGGSVAQQLIPAIQAAFDRYVEANGLALTPAIGSLALGGYKEPAQVVSLAYAYTLGARFDIAVNVDGVNDIVDPPIQYIKGVFPFYPSHWALRLRSLWTPEELELLARAEDLAQHSRSFAEQASGAWYGRSAIFGLPASLVVARERRDLAEVEMQLEAAAHEHDFQSTGPTPHFEQEELLARAAEVWRESSRLLHAMVTAVGGEYYHFLQPNQYVPESKPLTPHERRVAYRPSNAWGKGVLRGYPYLIREGRKLTEAGIAFRDTTQVFAGEDDDIYIDTCCHLTPRGTERLAAEILETILERTQIEALRRSADLGP